MVIHGQACLIFLFISYLSYYLHWQTLPDKRWLSHGMCLYQVMMTLHFLNDVATVGTQRAYFELKYFKIVNMRDAKYTLKMAAEKWRQKFPFLNALYS